MRVLIIRNAMPYDFGGAERFAVDIAGQLQSHHGVEPLVVSRSAKLLDYAKQQGIAHKRGWWWRRQHWHGKNLVLLPVYLLWQLTLFIWYIVLISRWRPQVVHPQSKDDFIAATLAARLLGKRVVWTDHADLKYIYANHQVWFKNPIGKIIYACSKLASTVTLVSNSELKLISTTLGKNPGANYRVVYNGVVDKLVSPRDRNPTSFIFCATSRLVTAKGIGELIEAFAAFCKKHNDAKLWLVGDGPEAERFKKHARNVPGVNFIGHSETPLEYVATADVFVHPSYHEGFSISLIEAAMLGKPIIACAVGGNPEIIIDHQTGLLVEAKNTDQLLQAMELLYSDRQLAAKLGTNARQNFENHFQFEKIVVEEFIPIYEK